MARLSKRKCSVGDCARPVVAWDLCSLHYQRWRRNGATTAPGPDRGQGRGEANPRWSGGRHLSKEGYVILTVYPGHPLYTATDGKRQRIKEHRAVMAEALGRPLAPYETVHHINGNTTDNRLANLQLRVGKHGKGIRLQCADCGSHDIKEVEL